MFVEHWQLEALEQRVKKLEDRLEPLLKSFEAYQAEELGHDIPEEAPSEQPESAPVLEPVTDTAALDTPVEASGQTASEVESGGFDSEAHPRDAQGVFIKAPEQEAADPKATA